MHIGFTVKAVIGGHFFKHTTHYIFLGFAAVEHLRDWFTECFFFSEKFFSQLITDHDLARAIDIPRSFHKLKGEESKKSGVYKREVFIKQLRVYTEVTATACIPHHVIHVLKILP